VQQELAETQLYELLQQRCPSAFASRPVFLSQARQQQMHSLIAAIEQVIALPAYQHLVLQRAPAIARHPSAARGVLMGYDFHACEQACGLIEINTNAGGIMLNALLARAQRACCEPVQGLIPPSQLADQLHDRLVAMFRREWALAGDSQRPLQSIAIVDQQPEAQYLYPEFLLFQQLLQRHGIRCVIADPAELSLRDGKLWHADLCIDLVYNRLTDFYLQEPAHAVLRDAWLGDACVLTPHPRAHALYADKRNLTLLSDPEQLQALGVPADLQQILLAGIPRTECVTAENSERLWQNRRRLFFKATDGYGSRAAWRGDKLTQRVWQEILAGDYVAQALVAPGERALAADPEHRPLKFDLRNYVYDGQIDWLAARLYQGQTTNFRTPGGGFAPVYSLPGAMPAPPC